MKKVLLGCFILSALAFADNHRYVEAKLGMSAHTKYSDIKASTGKLVDSSAKMNGFEVAVEGMTSLGNLGAFGSNVDFGVGLAYKKGADRKKGDSALGSRKGGDYDSIPLYLTTKYKFDLGKSFMPYFKVNLGYAFNTGEGKIAGLKTKVDNGLYYALGGGVEYNNLTFELMYGKVDSKIKLDVTGFNSRKISADRKDITLSVGYKFNF